MKMAIIASYKYEEIDMMCDKKLWMIFSILILDIVGAEREKVN